MPVARIEWTEENRAFLVTQWNAGESAGKIVAALHARGIYCERSAVLGKIFRMRKDGVEFQRRRKEQPQVQLRRGQPPKPRTHGFNIKELGGVFELPAEIPTDQAVLFLDVGADQCRWPIAGAGVAMVCCGNDVWRDRPYCAGHCRMAYMRPKPLKPRAWTTFGKAA